MAAEKSLPQYWEPDSTPKLSDEAQLGHHPFNPPATEEQREKILDVINGPTFTLRAHDPLAPALIKHWAELSAFNTEVSPSQLQKARETALAMERWQKDRGIAP